MISNLTAFGLLDPGYDPESTATSASTMTTIIVAEITEMVRRAPVTGDGSIMAASSDGFRVWDTHALLDCEFDDIDWAHEDARRLWLARLRQAAVERGFRAFEKLAALVPTPGFKATVRRRHRRRRRWFSGRWRN